jgi:hypothetical protein
MLKQSTKLRLILGDSIMTTYPQFKRAKGSTVVAMFTSETDSTQYKFNGCKMVHSTSNLVTEPCSSSLWSDITLEEWSDIVFDKFQYPIYKTGTRNNFYKVTVRFDGLNHGIVVHSTNPDIPANTQFCDTFPHFYKNEWEDTKNPGIITPDGQYKELVKTNIKDHCVGDTVLIKFADGCTHQECIVKDIKRTVNSTLYYLITMGNNSFDMGYISSELVFSVTKKEVIGTPYHSRYAIGEKVKFVTLDGTTIDCWIRAVIFTSSKVRYSIQLNSNGQRTTLHNVDSFYIKDGDGSIDTEMTQEDDNYS